MVEVLVIHQIANDVGACVNKADFVDGNRYLEGFEENTLTYRRINQELDVLLIFHIKLM